jgi:hypothetical protein
MQIHRNYVLATLAGLTLFFLGTAAYNLWNWQKPNESQTDAALADSLPQSGVLAADMLTASVPAALRLTVKESGIVVVTASQLQSANLPVSDLSPNTLQITRAGEQVPFLVDGSAEEGRLFFFAQAVTNTLEAPAVYLLSLGQGTLLRKVDAAPTTAEAGENVGRFTYYWEENQAFLQDTAVADLWLGPLILAPNTWNLSLDEVRANGGASQVTVQLWSSTEGVPDPDHHVDVLINGRQLASWYWDGIRQQTLTVNLPAGELQANYNNLLTLRTPGDTGAAGEAHYLNWIQVQYEGELDAAFTPLWFKSKAANIRIDNTDEPLLIFDVTNAKAPLVLANFTYEQGVAIHFAGRGTESKYLAIRQSDLIQPAISPMPQWETPLRQADLGADYVAIVADGTGFEEALQPLLDYRAEQGMRVTAVSLTQIYDEFNYGQPSINAIRNFLAYTAANWQPAPQYVLLVGDASYDINNQTQGKNKNLLPAAYVRTSEGETASDAWFTQFEGGEGMMIGRFPVQTANQLSAIVNKTITYESSGSDEMHWNDYALLVADDEPKFDTMSDELAVALNDGGYTTYKLYMTQNENIHYDIMSALNRGVGLVNYVGHGGATMWGDESVLSSEDATMLNNRSRLPIFTTFTSLNGAFTHPKTDSLAESLLWVKDGGVVAAVAPSGRGNIGYQLPLTDQFFDYFLNRDVMTLGEAVGRLRQANVADANMNNVTRTINLLGDPALRLQLPDDS